MRTETWRTLRWGGKPPWARGTTTHSVVPRPAAGGHAAECRRHVPCHSLAAGAQPGTAEARAGARGPSPGSATSHPPLSRLQPQGD